MVPQGEEGGHLPQMPHPGSAIEEGHAQRASVEENILIPITPPKAKQ